MIIMMMRDDPFVRSGARTRHVLEICFDKRRSIGSKRAENLKQQQQRQDIFHRVQLVRWGWLFGAQLASVGSSWRAQLGPISDIIDGRQRERERER